MPLVQPMGTLASVLAGGLRLLKTDLKLSDSLVKASALGEAKNKEEPINKSVIARIVTAYQSTD